MKSSGAIPEPFTTSWRLGGVMVSSPCTFQARSGWSDFQLIWGPGVPREQGRPPPAPFWRDKGMKQSVQDLEQNKSLSITQAPNTPDSSEYGALPSGASTSLHNNNHNDGNNNNMTKCQAQILSIHYLRLTTCSLLLRGKMKW